MKPISNVFQDYTRYINSMSQGEKISTSPLSKLHELSEAILRISHTAPSQDLTRHLNQLKGRHATEELFDTLEKKLNNQSSRKFSSKSEMLIKTKKNILQSYHDVGLYMSSINRGHIENLRLIIPLYDGPIENPNEAHQYEEDKKNILTQVQKLEEDLKVYTEWIG